MKWYSKKPMLWGLLGCHFRQTVLVVQGHCNVNYRSIQLHWWLCLVVHRQNLNAWISFLWEQPFVFHSSLCWCRLVCSVLFRRANMVWLSILVGVFLVCSNWLGSVKINLPRSQNREDQSFDQHSNTNDKTNPSVLSLDLLPSSSCQISSTWWPCIRHQNTTRHVLRALQPLLVGDWFCN